MARVTSTTPRFEPRWPPLTATAWTMNSRISPASVTSSPSVSVRRSAGEVMVSRTMRYRTLQPVTRPQRTARSMVAAGHEHGQLTERDLGRGVQIRAVEGGQRAGHELVDLALDLVLGAGVDEDLLYGGHL